MLLSTEYVRDQLKIRTKETNRFLSELCPNAVPVRACVIMSFLNIPRLVVSLVCVAVRDGSAQMGEIRRHGGRRGLKS